MARTAFTKEISDRCSKTGQKCAKSNMLVFLYTCARAVWTWQSSERARTVECYRKYNRFKQADMAAGDIHSLDTGVSSLVALCETPQHWKGCLFHKADIVSCQCDQNKKISKTLSSKINLYFFVCKQSFPSFVTHKRRHSGPRQRFVVVLNALSSRFQVRVKVSFGLFFGFEKAQRSVTHSPPRRWRPPEQREPPPPSSP